MATKTTQNPYDFENWTKMAQDYTDFVFETTRKSIDQTLSLTARTTDLMVETARKAQEWGLKEQARAFEMAGEFQAQVKQAVEQGVQLANDFSK